ncbi:MAG: sulfur transferase domain-containing protein, partial [Gammaproteobacteria bacterium]
MSLTRLAILSLGFAALAGCQPNPSQGLNPAQGLMNRAEPLPNVVTSGQPDADSINELAGAGYVAVIDLRGIDEDRGFDERAVVESAGMSYISLPVSGAADVTYENAALLDDILGNVRGPVLLHCASSNRVGALLSLRARMQGASQEDALAL